MSAAHTTKRHTNSMSVIVFVLGLLLVSGNTVFAIPYLQLDVEGGIYVGSPEESVVIPVDVFTLYALVDSSQGSTDGPFFLSIALVPQLDTAEDLGSFMIDDITIDVVGVFGEDDNIMTYGIPPVNLFSNPGQLAPHGIFETYFYELEFTLDPSMRAGLYNSMDEYGGFDGGLEQETLGLLYYQEFMVDATGLNDYFLHFDLYTTGSPTIDEFAPFSHDAQHTPVPGAVLLGILGLGVAGIKLRKFT